MSTRPLSPPPELALWREPSLELGEKSPLPHSAPNQARIPSVLYLLNGEGEVTLIHFTSVVAIRVWWIFKKRLQGKCTALYKFIVRSPGEGIGYPHQYSWASLVAQMVKNTTEIRETWARSLGWEDPLEKEMATHSYILAWRVPIDRGAWQATVPGVRVRHDWATKHNTSSEPLSKDQLYPCRSWYHFCVSWPCRSPSCGHSQAQSNTHTVQESGAESPRFVSESTDQSHKHCGLACSVLAWFTPWFVVQCPELITN